MSPTIPSTWDPAGPAPSKEQFYNDVYEQVAAVLDPSLPTSANLANVSAVVYWAPNDPPMPRQINWVGFYLNERYYPASSNELLSTSMKPELLLGPFQGRVACKKIKFGVGVCGTAAAERKTVVVPNVHEFPGHIACDSASESEIVVPLLLKGDDGSFSGVVGVFDFDCLKVNGFNEDDKHGIERIADLVSSSCRGAEMNLAFFADWAGKKCGLTSRFGLTVKNSEGKGCGLFTTAETICEPGRPLLVLPTTLLINASKVKEIATSSEFAKDTLLPLIELLKDHKDLERRSIILFLLWCKRISLNSSHDEWSPYISVLPTSFVTPVFYEEILSCAKEATRNELRKRIREMGLWSVGREKRTKLRSEYDEYVPYFKKLWSSHSSAGVSFDDFTWADAVYHSRAIKLSSQVANNTGDDLHLLPVIDMCNHSPTPNARWEFSESVPRTVQLLPFSDDTRALPADTEIFISYGETISSSELMNVHGFVAPCPKDRVTIPAPILERTYEEDSGDDIVLWKRGLMEAMNLPPMVDIGTIENQFVDDIDVEKGVVGDWISRKSFAVMALSVLTTDDGLFAVREDDAEEGAPTAALVLQEDEKVIKLSDADQLCDLVFHQMREQRRDVLLARIFAVLSAELDSRITLLSTNEDDQETVSAESKEEERDGKSRMVREEQSEYLLNQLKALKDAQLAVLLPAFEWCEHLQTDFLEREHVQKYMQENIYS